jgi:hypothetical protein
LYKNLASPIADAAKVLIGPALIAFTLIPFVPKSLEIYFTLRLQSGFANSHYIGVRVLL